MKIRENCTIAPPKLPHLQNFNVFQILTIFRKHVLSPFENKKSICCSAFFFANTMDTKETYFLHYEINRYFTIVIPMCFRSSVSKVNKFSFPFFSKIITPIGTINTYINLHLYTDDLPQQQFSVR